VVESPGIDAAVERSNLVREALEIARRAHFGQIRSGSNGRPYIEHPIAVAELLAEQAYSEEVLAAALLHDVVEDTDMTVEDIRERVGSPVAELVEVLSDDPSIESYAERKREHRDRVDAADDGARAIFAADKLANVRMLRVAYRVRGEGIAEELKVPLDEKIKIWSQDLEKLLEGTPDAALVTDLGTELAGLAGDRATQARSSSS
jgi:guanosine-3',5'-bis(diphosphate) 3'-pyrophosphohydrolase